MSDLLQYTSVDMANAIKYANQRNKLRMLKHMSNQSLHISSWLDYKIKPADPHIDYYFPESFANKAIMVDVTLTEESCNKVSCNVMNNQRICTFNEDTQVYRLGQTDKVGHVCQPACYNLAKVATYNDDGTMKTQSLRTAWVPEIKSCSLVPATATYMEMPRIRSKEVFAHRLNDLALGFDPGERDSSYGVTGKTYKYNEYYCDVYGRKFDTKKEQCEYKWWDDLLNSVVGENIINILKVSIIELTNIGGPLPTPTNLPSLPPVPPNLLLDAWRKDVNPDFIMPNEKITLSELNMKPLITKHNIKPTEQRTQHTEENFQNTDQIIDSMYKNCYLKISHLKRCIPTLQRRQMDRDMSAKSMKIDGADDKQIEDNEENETDGNHENAFWETVGKIIQGLLKMTTTTEFYKTIALSKLAEKILLNFRLALNLTMDKFLPMLMKSVVEGTELLLSNVVMGAIAATLTNTVLNVTVKLISQTVLVVAKLLAEVISVVGIILVIVSLFDIMLAFWDPLGFNNFYSKEILEQINFNGELALRRQLALPEPTMTFDILCHLMITKDDQMYLNLLSFGDIYEYLDSLTVNSEGSRIEKGVVVNKASQPTDFTTRLLAKRNIYTEQEFLAYEKDHRERFEFWRTKSRIILWVLGGSFVFFSLIRVWFAVLIILILILLLVFLTYLNAVVNVSSYLRNSLPNTKTP